MMNGAVEVWIEGKECKFFKPKSQRDKSSNHGILRSSLIPCLFEVVFRFSLDQCHEMKNRKVGEKKENEPVIFLTHLNL